MNTPSANVTELRKAFDFRTLNETLRSGGVGSLIFGAIALAMGIATFEESELNGILAVIGAGLILEGLYVMLHPSPFGLVVDGLALLTVGGWNLFITSLNMENGGGVPLFGMLGAYQVYLAFQTFAKYPGYNRQFDGIPSKEARKQVDEMITATLGGGSGESGNVIEFSEEDARWRAGFFGSVVVLAKNDAEEVLFMEAADLQAARRGEVPAGDAETVELKVGDRVVHTQMTPQTVSAYAQWKLAAA